MKHIHKAAATTLAVTMLAGITGCSAQHESDLPDANQEPGADESTAEQASEPLDTDSQLNADGNYNILLVTVDQEHYFDEYPEGTNYKARQLLAEMGTTFEKHYACSNMSTSSRSVLYTGTHITDTKMLDNTDFAWQGAMSEEITTIADRLNQAGYYSAYKGKWHMGDASILQDRGDTLTDLTGYGFSDWGAHGDYIGEAQEGYGTDPVITEDSIKWLSETGMKLNEEGQSFFLAVNLINPHDIMNLSTQDDFTGGTLELLDPPDDEVYEKSYDVPLPSTWEDDLSGTVEAVRAYKKRWGNQTGTLKGEEGFKELQDYYFNCIQDSDNNLMVLLDALDDLGLYDNTIIVFTADHGEMQGAHGLKGKGGFIYDNNIHVPLIIYHPDYEGGRTVSSVTSHMDLAPTLIDMTNLPEEEKAELSEGLAGSSLLPLISGEKESVRDGSLFCYEMFSFAADYVKDADGNSTIDLSNLDNRRFVRAIITERYKFARYFSPGNFNTPQTFKDLTANNDIELYDLQSDPEETNNLALEPEKNQELIMEMNEALNGLIEKEIGTDDGSEFREMMSAFIKTRQSGDSE